MRISDWSSDVCSSDLAAGVSILGPAVAAGFYELARRREQGLDSSWRHFFDVFSGPSFVPLVTLTVFLAVLFLLWLGAAWTIFQMTLGSLDPPGIGSFLSLLSIGRAHV